MYPRRTARSEVSDPDVDFLGPQPRSQSPDLFETSQRCNLSEMFPDATNSLRLSGIVASHTASNFTVPNNEINEPMQYSVSVRHSNFNHTGDSRFYNDNDDEETLAEIQNKNQELNFNLHSSTSIFSEQPKPFQSSTDRTDKSYLFSKYGTQRDDLASCFESADDSNPPSLSTIRRFTFHVSQNSVADDMENLNFSVRPEKQFFREPDNGCQSSKDSAAGSKCHQPFLPHTSEITENPFRLTEFQSASVEAEHSVSMPNNNSRQNNPSMETSGIRSFNRQSLISTSNKIIEPVPLSQMNNRQHNSQLSFQTQMHNSTADTVPRTLIYPSLHSSTLSRIKPTTLSHNSGRYNNSHPIFQTSNSGGTEDPVPKAFHHSTAFSTSGQEFVKPNPLIQTNKRENASLPSFQTSNSNSREDPFPKSFRHSTLASDCAENGRIPLHQPSRRQDSVNIPFKTVIPNSKEDPMLRYRYSKSSSISSNENEEPISSSQNNGRKNSSHPLFQYSNSKASEGTMPRMPSSSLYSSFSKKKEKPISLHQTGDNTNSLCLPPHFGSSTSNEIEDPLPSTSLQPPFQCRPIFPNRTEEAYSQVQNKNNVNPSSQFNDSSKGHNPLSTSFCPRLVLSSSSRENEDPIPHTSVELRRDNFNLSSNSMRSVDMESRLKIRNKIKDPVPTMISLRNAKTTLNRSENPLQSSSNNEFVYDCGSSQITNNLKRKETSDFEIYPNEMKRSIARQFTKPKLQRSLTRADLGEAEAPIPSSSNSSIRRESSNGSIELEFPDGRPTSDPSNLENSRAPVENINSVLGVPDISSSSSQLDNPNVSTADAIRNLKQICIAGQSSSSESDSDLVIMAVFWRKGMLGGAYYTADTSEIHVANDIVDVRPEFHVLESLYNLVEPNKVLVPAQVPESFISVLKALTGYESPATEENSVMQKKLHILSRKDYNMEACRRRVLTLKLPSEPKESNEDEHLLYLNSLINMTNESMIQALGVLLKWLDMSWGYLQIEQNAQPPILAINTICLEDLVMIDQETYEALQIFSPRAHPSGFKRGMPGSFREGFSLFGIFNRCKSPHGCKQMRVIFHHPSRNIDELNARLDVVQFCTNPNNEDIVENMLMCLKNIKSITRIISKLTRLSASFREWKSLHKTIYYSILLGSVCKSCASKAKLFAEIADSVTEEMHQVEYSIGRVIDFKESEKQNSFVVSLGLDDELDRKKQAFGGISKVMSDVAHQELKSLPPYIKECSMVYIPEIGYLLAITGWKENMLDDDWEIPGIDFMFKLTYVGHYKSARCRELDNVIGDSIVEIMKLESRILLQLVQFVQERVEPLHKLIKMSAVLDCLIAMSSMAKENNYLRPELTEERVLEIKGGRHPLQELCVDSFVPNDTFSDDSHSLMKIITGPNSSGKSIYLKQVALIAYLAHIGSYVPAEYAKIGILEHIHTRLQTVESVAMNISAFVIDLKQMLLSLYNSTPSSLIIVDEFGKGTTEIDGLALLASCLDHFLSREELCPHIFAATHFHNVTNLIRQSKYLKLQTMECIIESGGQVVNLFKIKDGSVNSSCAFAVAETILGSSAGARARKILRVMKNEQEKSVKPIEKMEIKMIRYKLLAQKILSADTSNLEHIEEIIQLCNNI